MEQGLGRNLFQMRQRKELFPTKISRRDQINELRYIMKSKLQHGFKVLSNIFGLVS